MISLFSHDSSHKNDNLRLTLKKHHDVSIKAENYAFMSLGYNDETIKNASYFKILLHVQ